MIRAVVVDDELPSLQRLGKMLCGSGAAEVIGAFSRPQEALIFLEENEADAVFLDIEMPDMDGIELATRILDLQKEIDIVFVTAYNQYAVEAFRLNALDYLLKPVTDKRLGEALLRVAAGKAAPAPSGALAIRCFGKFGVNAGAAQVHFRTEKAEELLAFLIDRGGGFVGRCKILDSLWEDFEGDRAMIHFNTTLHYIKKSLLPYGVQISIQYDRGSYRLDPREIACDYLKFCALTERAGTATGENIAAFEEAALLYTGEYLSDRDYCWAIGRRLYLEERYIGLLLCISEYYREAGEHRKASRWLRDGLLQEPLHRELNYRLIELMLMTHERVMAARHYELYRSGLMKKLGMEPDEGFRSLMLRLGF